MYGDRGNAAKVVLVVRNKLEGNRMPYRRIITETWRVEGMEINNTSALNTTRKCRKQHTSIADAEPRDAPTGNKI